MKLKSLLLYSLIFSSSSLFAYPLDCPPPSEDTYWRTLEPSTITRLGSATPLTSYSECGRRRSFQISTMERNTCNEYCYPDVIMTYYQGTMIPDCTLPEVFDIETESCKAPIPECKPEDNQVLDELTNTCRCIDGFTIHNDVCSKDTDGDSIPDVTDDDIDGDGIPNENDPDIDGDGIPNENDPDLDDDGDGIPNPDDTDDDGDGIDDSNDSDHPDYKNPDIGCNGPLKGSEEFYGTQLDLGSYVYYGILSKQDCSYKILLNSIKGSYSRNDKSSTCEDSYCYVSNVEDKCTFTANDYKPSKLHIYYSSAKTENECSAKVDGEKYISNSFEIPNSFDCPTIGFCFLLPKPDTPNATNQEDEDETMEAPDLNSTSQDNQALLQSQNTTNKHLQDLKDKTDDSNEKLDKLFDNSNDIKDINTQTKESIDNFSNKNSANFDKQIAEQKRTTDEVSNVSNKLSATNERLKSLNNSVDNLNRPDLTGSNYSLGDLTISLDGLNGL
jgi:hypothetical protein